MKKLIPTLTLSLALGLAACGGRGPAGLVIGGASAHAAASIDELSEKVLEAFNQLESYGFIVLEYENDRLWKENQARAAAERAGLIDEHGVATPTGEEPEEFKTSVFEMRIIKPFDLKLTIRRSDYIPQLIWNGVSIYKPGEDSKNFVFIPPQAPIPVKQDITSETGSFLLQNWTVEMIRFQQFLKNAEKVAVREAPEKVANRDCWLVEMEGFPNPMKFDYELGKWGIPEEAFFKIHEEMETKGAAGMTGAKFWFDKELLVPVQREHYIDGEFFGRWTYNQIRINSVEPF